MYTLILDFIREESKKPDGLIFSWKAFQRRGNIIIDQSIDVLCGILKLMVCSTTEAELVVLFLNIREAKISRLMLEEMGRAQPATPVHCNNSTVAGIANNTAKKQRAHVSSCISDEPSVPKRGRSMFRSRRE